MSVYSSHDVLRTRLCAAAGCEHDAAHGPLCTSCARASRAGRVIRIHIVEQPAGETPTTLWCGACKQWKPDEAFSLKRQLAKRRQRATECKACAAARRRANRAANPEPIRVRERDWKRAAAARKRAQEAP